MKNIVLVIATFIILFGFAQVSAANALLYQVDYSDTSQFVVQKDARLVIQTLKYEPYPVNAGDWFDIWFKVQNVGQGDANDVSFELISEYPFSSNDSIRDYGLIYGTVNAYKVDQTYDSNQVILKYRVKVADNAPAGENLIKLKVTTDKATSSERIYSLPVDVAKTKTDFELVMQDSTTQGVSFAIANIGDNDATAVVVSIKSDEKVNMTGSSSSVLGNLAKGDYTTVTFQLFLRNNLNVTVQISYTDTAGVRNTIDKVVTVNADNSLNQLNINSKTTTKIPEYTYLAIGIMLGIAIAFVYTKIRQKR